MDIQCIVQGNALDGNELPSDNQMWLAGNGGWDDFGLKSVQPFMKLDLKDYSLSEVNPTPQMLPKINHDVKTNTDNETGIKI